MGMLVGSIRASSVSNTSEVGSDATSASPAPQEPKPAIHEELFLFSPRTTILLNRPDQPLAGFKRGRRFPPARPRPKTA